MCETGSISLPKSSGRPRTIRTKAVIYKVQRKVKKVKYQVENMPLNYVYLGEVFNEFFEKLLAIHPINASSNRHLLKNIKLKEKSLLTGYEQIFENTTHVENCVF